MKSIGIISMQRIINYGSFLQAYGLKRLIEGQINCNVEFIDYQYEQSLVESDIVRESVISKIKKNRSVVKYLAKKKYFRDVEKSLVDDLKKIGVDHKNYNRDVDAVVIGSDEVFNCMQPYPVGYSRELFGKGFEDKTVISYAASFGHTKIKDLERKGIKNEVQDMLSKFARISVRDDNSAAIVAELLGAEPLHHMDPVLMYEYDDEMKTYNTDESGYIIVYAYAGRLTIEEERYIKQFARAKKKKIYSIGHYSRIADKNIICHPFYVFSYFKNADYIITDTFHGTVFSIKTNSKFCTIIRDGNRNKLESLLKSLNQYGRAVHSLKDIERLYSTNIDYKATNEIIEREREKSKQYLKESLQ